MSKYEDAMAYFNNQSEFMNERINSGINQNRKAYTNVRFTDKEGNTIKNLNFQASQKSHDFNFGCNLFMLDEFEDEKMNKQYRDKFPELFNYAVVPFYWRDLEPEKGKPRYDKNSKKIYRRPAPDLVMEYCQQNNIRMKGHCLVYDAYRPKWLLDDVLSDKMEIKKHLIEIAKRYGSSIFDWDVINETLGWEPYYHRVSKFYREDDFITYTYDVVKNLPFERKFINEGGRHVWEYFQFIRTPYYMLLEKLIRQNVKFDLIGMQFHINHKKEMSEIAKHYFNPVKMYGALDTFSRLNKPIQISEVTIPSEIDGYDDDDMQAEIVANLYKMWFSHKGIDGIVYWNLVDNTAAATEMNTTAGNRFRGGLLNSDLSPKPIYKKLDNLINKEWHTEETFGVSKDTGIATVYGFKGKYDLDIYYNDKHYSKELHICENCDLLKEKVIVLD